jgi:hypothetical protein
MNSNTNETDSNHKNTTTCGKDKNPVISKAKESAVKGFKRAFHNANPKTMSGGQNINSQLKRRKIQAETKWANIINNYKNSCTQKRMTEVHQKLKKLPNIRLQKKWGSSDIHDDDNFCEVDYPSSDEMDSEDEEKQNFEDMQGSFYVYPSNKDPSYQNYRYSDDQDYY